MRQKTRQKLPAGWTEKKIRAVIDHYDNQTDEEAAAEIESAPVADETLLLVPNPLVKTVCRLIREFEKNGRRRKAQNLKEKPSKEEDKQSGGKR